jgi:acyl dehydratase
MAIPLVLSTPRELLEQVGKDLAVTDWFELTQDRIRQFADATEDRQWIHLDRERAERESPYRTTIAHGFLTLSLLSHLMRQAIQIRGMSAAINYGLNRVRFPAPVPAGSKIRARFTLQSAKEVGGAVEAVFLANIESQGATKPCCVAEWIVRYRLAGTGSD